MQHLRAGAERASRSRPTARCLVSFSPLAVALLAAAAVPAFVAESALLGRGLPPVSLAHAGDAPADLPRVGDRPRGLRQGGEALRPRPAAARSLRRIFRRLYARTAGSPCAAALWGFVLGLLSTAAFYGAYALDRARGGPRHDHARRHDDVRAGLQAGAGGAERVALGDRRHVRGQPLPVEPLRVPRDAESRRRPARTRSGRTRATASASRTVAFTYPGNERPALSGVSLPPRAGPEARAGRRERLGQDHAHQAAHPALRADRAAASCSTAPICASGTSARCAAASASSSRTSCATSSSSARTSASATSTTGDDEARWQRGRRGRHGGAVHRRAAARLPDPARPLVPGRPRALGRPVAEDRAVARLHARGRRHPGARRADRRDGRRGRGADLRALPRGHEGPDGDPDLAPLLDRAHGRPHRRADPTDASSKRAATRSSSRTTAYTRGSSRCRRPATADRPPDLWRRSERPL